MLQDGKRRKILYICMIHKNVTLKKKLKKKKKTFYRGSGSAIAQLGERRSLVSELHTNLVRVRASPASMYFQPGRCIKKQPKCMWSGCRRADPVVSQAYSRDAEICPGFPPP